jgi:hypothetical protein
VSCFTSVAIASLGVLGLDALDEAWSGLLRAQVWRTAFSYSYSATAVCACVASLLALGALESSVVIGK